VVAPRRGQACALPSRRRSRRSSDLFALATTVAILVATARRAYSHPLHTTLTEVTFAADGGVELVLRAFVDDFAAAVSGRRAVSAATTVMPADSATARYLGGTLVVSDGAGRRLPWRLGGVRRAGDLVWVTLKVPGGGRVRDGVGGPRLTNRVLFETYDDQVNIVQAMVAGRRHTVLFTRRDGVVAKAVAP
jgi:hypothetical protein